MNTNKNVIIVSIVALIAIFTITIMVNNNEDMAGKAFQKNIMVNPDLEDESNTVDAIIECAESGKKYKVSKGCTLKCGGADEGCETTETCTSGCPEHTPS